MSRLIEFQSIPLPDVRENDMPGWGRDLIASLTETIQNLHYAMTGVGVEFATASFDLTVKPLIGNFAAAVDLAKGDICYLDSNGKMAFADADDETKSKSLLGLCQVATLAGVYSDFLLRGMYTTTGLTTGDVLFLSTTATEWTNAVPTISGNVLRVIGYASSTTQLFFHPDNTWLEIS